MSKLDELYRLVPKLYYSLDDFVQYLGMMPETARVFLSRKVGSGELIRLKRNIYILPRVFQQCDERDLFILANIIQTPSYISYATALSFYGVTTQVIPSIIESANPVRTKSFERESTTFSYRYCQSQYYFGYKKLDGFFIALPEKALLDMLYLISVGRYAFAEDIDIKKLDEKLLIKMTKEYPDHFKEFFKRWRQSHEDTD